MKIQSIGFIETKGLIAAIVGADAMTKAANVEIVGSKYFKVKSGIVTVIVTGDVGAVKAAVEVGAEAASKAGTLITSHAIARPDEFVMKMILPNSYEEVKEELKKKDKIEVKENNKQTESKKKDKKQDIEKETIKNETTSVKNEEANVKLANEEVKLETKEDIKLEIKEEAKQEEMIIKSDTEEVKELPNIVVEKIQPINQESNKNNKKAKKEEKKNNKK